VAPHHLAGTIILQKMPRFSWGFNKEFHATAWTCNYYSKWLLLLAAGKGQLISKLLFGFLNFPKNQRKNLKDFCPRI
jgi:hypothetical protein